MWYFIGNIRNVLLLLSTWEARSDGGTLACEQAVQSTLTSGWEKEGELATTSPEFEYLHQKVDEKCWLAKMSLVTTSLSWYVFFNICLHLCSSPLRADWQKSDSSVYVNPQGNWTWNSNSRDIGARSPSFSSPASRAPRRACSQTGGKTQI